MPPPRKDSLGIEGVYEGSTGSRLPNTARVEVLEAGYMQKRGWMGIAGTAGYATTRT